MDLKAIYTDYIACLNARDLLNLGTFVSDNVVHNGRSIGLTGYRDIIAGNYADIPDLRFVVDLLVSEPPFVASRLRFDCRPKARFRGLDVGGRRVTFDENVFYRFAAGRIVEVWSVIDKAEIEAQLLDDRHA